MSEDYFCIEEVLDDAVFTEGKIVNIHQFFIYVIIPDNISKKTVFVPYSTTSNFYSFK